MTVQVVALGIGDSTLYKVLNGSHNTYRVLASIKEGLNLALSAYEALPHNIRSRLSYSQWAEFLETLIAAVGIDELISIYGTGNPEKARDPRTIWFDGPQRTIERFFKSVNERAFSIAWDTLHPQFREDFWQGRYADFLNGYRNMKETVLTHLEPVPQESLETSQFVGHATIRCTTLIPNFTSLAGIAEIPFTDAGIAELATRLKKFRKEIAALGCSTPNLGALTMWLVARPASGDAVRWLLDRSGKWDQALLRSEEKIAYVQEITCLPVNDGSSRWLIRRLRRMA